MDRISAFMDGETRRREARQTILNLEHNQEYCETWKTFHLIGDVMRGDPLLHEDFAQRLRSRLEDEPTVLGPRFSWRKSPRLALPAAASLAAICVVLLLVFTDNPLRPRSPVEAVSKPPSSRIAQTEASPQPKPLPAASQNGVNEYLMAHQEFSPSTALQGVAPYVRTVSAAHDANGH